MKNFISIKYSGQKYNLALNKRHAYLNSDNDLDYLYEINKDDIRLTPSLSVLEYKQVQNELYTQQNSSLTFLKFLEQASIRDFGFNWSTLIEQRTQIIKTAWTNFFINQGMLLRQSNINAVHEIADNGLIAAIYCLGTFYASGGRDDAVFWLVKAHNLGNLSAAYELATFMDEKKSYANAIKSLIASADNGLDHAFLTVFHPSIIDILLKAQKTDDVINILDELIESTKYSTARYLKSICYLFQNQFDEAFRLLDDCIKEPQNPLGEKGWLEKNNQNKLVKEYLTKLKSEVFRNRKDFLKIIDILAKDFCFISFKDYREFVNACEKEKIIQFG